MVLTSIVLWGCRVQILSEVDLIEKRRRNGSSEIGPSFKEPCSKVGGGDKEKE